MCRSSVVPTLVIMNGANTVRPLDELNADVPTRGMMLGAVTGIPAPNENVPTRGITEGDIPASVWLN